MLFVPNHLVPKNKKEGKILLTADEHYRHRKILLYQPERPWNDLETMETDMVANHNAIATEQDRTIHIGDFCFGHKEDFVEIVRKLNGRHFFLDGSHDRALEEYYYWDKKPEDVAAKVTILPKLFEFRFQGWKISLLHYQMAKWWCSHYDKSAHFFGHSHGRAEPIGRARDVGVDAPGIGWAPIPLETAIKSLQ